MSKATNSIVVLILSCHHHHPNPLRIGFHVFHCLLIRRLPTILNLEHHQCLVPPCPNHNPSDPPPSSSHRTPSLHPATTASFSSPPSPPVAKCSSPLPRS